jgi:hypothetical protein
MINRRLQCCCECMSGRQQHLCNEKTIFGTTPFGSIDSLMLRNDKLEESVHIQYCCNSRVISIVDAYDAVRTRAGSFAALS